MQTVHSFAPWPQFADDEIAATVAVLQSGKVNYWTGDIGRAFERDYATATQRRHGIAVANGTLALELALYAFGIGPGDEVITASRTYVASASCANTGGIVTDCVGAARGLVSSRLCARRAFRSPRRLARTRHSLMFPPSGTTAGSLSCPCNATSRCAMSFPRRKTCRSFITG